MSSKFLSVEFVSATFYEPRVAPPRRVRYGSVNSG
jgi:hypothetical protein